MEGDRRLSLVVGGFTLLSLVLLAVTILSLSSQRGIFSTQYELRAYYENVQGLVAGAEVRLAGTRVGRVTSVTFGTRPQTAEPAVEVRLQVDADVQSRIRGDSRARISTIGLLGDQIVAISMGTESAPPLGDGDEIATLSPFDINELVSQGSSTLQSINSLAQNLEQTLQALGAEEVGSRFRDVLGGVNDIVGEIREGEGALHSLVYEPYEGGAVKSVERSVASLENILREVESGDGVLHSLIYDAPSEQDMVLQMIEAGARLNSILAKVDRGEGTLGLLLNDPTLYEEVKLLVGGANRSTLVRSLINLISTDEN